MKNTVALVCFVAGVLIISLSFSSCAENVTEATVRYIGEPVVIPAAATGADSVFNPYYLNGRN